MISTSVKETLMQNAR